METYTVTQVANLLSVSAPTVRRWAGAFADHLSSGANPPAGSERVFVADDVRVFSYAKGRLSRGASMQLVAEEVPTATLPTWAQIIREGVMIGGESHVVGEEGQEEGTGRLTQLVATSSAQQVAVLGRIADSLGDIAEVGALRAEIDDLRRQVASLKAQVETLQRKSHTHRSGFPYRAEQ